MASFLRQVYSAASTLPMAMRYRNLRKKVKQTVGVYKSSIHGMGLFCKQSIDPAEMVIEYAGTVIRSALTDKREKYYNSKVSMRYRVCLWQEFHVTYKLYLVYQPL